MDLAFKYRLLILFAISFIATCLVFGPILKIAKMKDIVDNPEARKLQKEPVPVMGGIAVFFGISVGLCFYKTMIVYTSLFPVFGAMIVMLYIGAIDDILSIYPAKRLILEVIVALVLLYGLKFCIMNFQGLWGIDNVSLWIGLILSVITFLGVVNAINMTDGIDGLSTAFCIYIMGTLGVFCFLSRDYSFSVLSAVSIGALIPFFIHNVFGTYSKMFIGDSGTMMVGTAISAMIFVILRKNNAIEEYFPEINFSRIAFVCAVMAIPIADTIRVMFYRILHHKSPFRPDNNHLHHILLRYGLAHPSITLVEIVLALAILGIFFLSWLLGASISLQVYIVLASAAAFDFGVAAVMKKLTKNK